jgi:hypothetical protein
MRRRFLVSVTLLASMLAIVPVARAQQATPKSTKAKSDSAAPFDPHDLSGVWDYFNNSPGQGIYVTPSKDMPPLTEWGKARFDANKPGYGPRAQAGGNDPILSCDPTGIPKILFMVLPHEIVETPARMFMFFEREHAWRQIWTDGRQHPKDPDPTYMGDSIGRWEGDTFIVDSVGFNDKSWLDFYGSPHSEEMHLIERYQRLDHDTLLMHLIIEDPKTYTHTWVSDDKIYKLLPPEKSKMEELFCVPSEEEAFKNRIRMPALKKPGDK